MSFDGRIEHTTMTNWNKSTNGFKPDECPNGCGNKSSEDGFVKTIMIVDDEPIFICYRCSHGFTESEYNEYIKQKKLNYEIEQGKFTQEPTEEEYRKMDEEKAQYLRDGN